MVKGSRTMRRFPIRQLTVAAVLALSVALAAVPALLAQSTPAEEALARLNFYRQASGVGLLTAQPQLTQAAANHANYYLLNKLYTQHDETQGNPGFTGEKPWDRTAAAGYPSVAAIGAQCVTENAASIGFSALAAVDGLVNTVSHRSSMISPLWTEFGFGMTEYGTSIKLGSQTCSLTDADQLILSPGRDQAGAPATFRPHTESPDPLPNVAPKSPPDALQVGTPISVGTRLGVHLAPSLGKLETPPEIDSFELTDPFGNSITDFYIVDDVNNPGWRYWMSKTSLNKGQTFTVRVVGRFVGQATGDFDVTWQFTTESAFGDDRVFLTDEPTDPEYRFRDDDEPRGYFRYYTQTAAANPLQLRTLAGNLLWQTPGFKISNLDDRGNVTGFLDKFEEIGFDNGVPRIGYPLSPVVSHRGVPIQFFQRGVMRRLGGSVEFLNIFDDLGNLPGVDAQLEAVSRIPKAIDHPQDAGKSIDEIEQRRLGELQKVAPAVYNFVTSFSRDDRLARFGLPVNWQVFGDLVGVRFQRMGFRQGVGVTNPNLVDQVLGGEKAKSFEVYLK